MATVVTKMTANGTGGNFKHTLFDQFPRIGKALGHANRLELLEYLTQGERRVDALATVSGLSVANTSQHLQHLRQAGLIAVRKEGSDDGHLRCPLVFISDALRPGTGEVAAGADHQFYPGACWPQQALYRPPEGDGHGSDQV